MRNVAAGFMNDVLTPKISKTVIHATQDVSAWAATLPATLNHRFHTPGVTSLETMQQASAKVETHDHQAVEEAVTRLQEDRAAGVSDADLDTRQVFIMGEPGNEEERNTLAAVSTALVASAINDPERTVAAFLPLNSLDTVSQNPNDSDPQPQVSAIRSVLNDLGVVSFESLEQLTEYLQRLA
jgi:hypothetical protein